jgi:hypothetical protein
MRSFGSDPLAVTAGLIVNHQAGTAAGFAGQMLDANTGRQCWPLTLQPDPGSYPAVLGRRGHLPNRRPLAMAETNLRFNNA